MCWYHPIIIARTQVMCCLSEPKAYELLRDPGRKVNDLFNPKTIFMSHDEIRVVELVQGLPRSQAHARRAPRRQREAVRRDPEGGQPRAEMIVWSDMFDPNHNAVKEYYLVNGTLEGSWEGLPRR